ncbi:MAG: hypothetical protein UHN88_08565, partial [Eubacterium sp.]|nr:hypothetical protein [Eubacterium sp.]
VYAYVPAYGGNMGLLILALVIRIVSAIVFTGIIAKLIADALNKAGVLKGYRISAGMKDMYEA